MLSGALEGRRIVDIDVVELGQTAGAVALTDDGGLLVAAARGLATISPEGSVSFGPDLLGERRDVRLNDGSVDPQGRFVVGTLALAAETGAEVLLRIRPMAAPRRCGAASGCPTASPSRPTAARSTMSTPFRARSRATRTDPVRSTTMSLGSSSWRTCPRIPTV